MEPSFINVGGRKIRFVDSGWGTPLVLVHGVTGYLEDWGANIEALAARHWVLALDLIGPGKADKPRELAYTQGEIAGSILGFLAEVDARAAA